MRSFSGERDVFKSKGFSLHYANEQVYNFDTLKEQILHEAINDQKEKLYVLKPLNTLTLEIDA